MLQGDYFYIHRCHSEAQPKNLNLNIQECEMLRFAQHDNLGGLSVCAVILSASEGSAFGVVA